jgi:hypothetical protein
MSAAFASTTPALDVVFIDANEQIRFERLQVRMRPARRANQRSACQAHHKKIFLFVSTPNHPYISRHPVPQEGRWPSSRTLGRDAVDAAALGAWWFSQGGLWSVSEHSVQTTGANARLSLVAKTGGCVRQKRVVPAPVAGVKLAEARRPNRVQTSLQSVSDGDKTNSSPRRARHKPSNHCAGNVGMLRLYLYARVRFSLCTFAHETAGAASTRHSLRPLNSRANDFTNLGRNAPRDCGVASEMSPILVFLNSEQFATNRCCKCVAIAPADMRFNVAEWAATPRA